VLVAVLQDRGGHARADAVELVELLRVRGVEVEWLPLGRCRAAPAARGGRGAPQRHEHLPPVLELGRQVERRQVGPATRAPRPADRVEHPRPRRQPVHARPPHGARHVHDEPSAAAAVGVGHMDRCGGGRRVVAPQVARAQQHHDQQAERPQEQHVAGGVGHIPRR